MTMLSIKSETLSNQRRNSTEAQRDSRIYAIAFDMDTELLKSTYGNNPSYNNAYVDIRKTLQNYGFDWQQGSVYFGKKTNINAVTCVLAVMELTRTFPWFAQSVRDIRMLRIEEENDLMPIVEHTSAEENGE